MKWTYEKVKMANKHMEIPSISHHEKVNTNQSEYKYTFKRMAKLGLTVMNVSRDAKQFWSPSHCFKNATWYPFYESFGSFL